MELSLYEISTTLTKEVITVSFIQKVKPILVLVRITENKSENESIKVTSWKKDSADPKLARWESRGRNMTMTTKLILNQRLKALFPICNDS